MAKCPTLAYNAYAIIWPCSVGSFVIHPIFFLMFISYTNRVRRVFAFTKKYTKFYFMTNEPTLLRGNNHTKFRKNRSRDICLPVLHCLEVMHFDWFWHGQTSSLPFQFIISNMP